MGLLLGFLQFSHPQQHTVVEEIDKFNYLQGLLDGATTRSIKGLT